MATLLQKRSKDLSDKLVKAAEKLQEEVSPKAVHRLRTTIRRMESLITYSHPKLGKKQERSLEQLEALRKRAGKVRDLDIQMGLLGSIANGSTRNDRRLLADFMKHKRSKQARRLASAVSSVEKTKFFSRLERIGEKSAEPPAENAGTPLEKAQCELTALAADSATGQELSPDQLHQARIKLKLIRYLAETSPRTEQQKEFVDRIKSVQDAMGEWHDWEMLKKTAETQFGDRINCALLVEIKSLFAVKHRAAVSGLNYFLAQFTVARGRKQPASATLVATAARRA